MVELGAGYLLFTAIFLILLKSAPSYTNIPTMQDREYWYAEAQKDLTKRLQDHRDHKPIARNIVMFIGDGMSIATVTAARELKKQRKGTANTQNGWSSEETLQGLIWDHFPASALAQTYNLNAQTGESSACATALLCGVKANYETLGVDGRATFENCSSSVDAKVSSILEWAQDAGKWTGIVTNTRVTHATPAALYAHTPSRYWEDDSKVPPLERKVCKDIALQLVDSNPGKNINVILGGGRRHFLPTVIKDPEDLAADGRRLDGRNLIEDWLRDKKRRKLNAEYVWNRKQFEEIDTDKVDYLLGLFEYSHMGFAADREEGPTADPTLEEMTVTALNLLDKSPKGFFLMVEGGRIDHAHHYNNPYRALDETLQFEAAVRAAISRVDLIVVTADHGHVMTMGGHGAPRDHPILGADLKPSDVDSLPYTSILYGNGPGYGVRPVLGVEEDPLNVDRDRVHGAAAPKQWATHGAEDVPVYAMGPMAKVLFSGTFEQSYIPHAVAYIACMGEQVGRCEDQHNFSQPQISTCPGSEANSPAEVSESHDPHPPGVVHVASSVMADDSSQRRTPASGSNNKGLSYDMLIISFICVLNRFIS